MSPSQTNKQTNKTNKQNKPPIQKLIFAHRHFFQSIARGFY
jgi:hypothetical protein